MNAVHEYNALVERLEAENAQLKTQVRYYKGIAEAWQKTLLKLIDAFNEVGEKGDTNGSE